MSGLRWAIARTAHGCDATRYLGELRLLPNAEERRPGDWCDLVVRDGLSSTRWRLVVVGDASRELQLAGAARGSTPAA